MSVFSKRETATTHTVIGGEPREVWLMVEGLDEAKMITDAEEGDAEAALLRKDCDWCGEKSGSGYFVAVGDQNYKVCSICWGRSPAYVDFRREGYSHEAACQKLMGNHGMGSMPA